MEFEKILDAYPEVWKSPGENIIVTKGALHNCQTTVVAGIDYILMYEGAEALKMLKEVNNLTKKNQILVDVSKNRLHILEDIIKQEDFIFKTPYVNSTKSNMVMCLFRTKNLIDNENMVPK